MQNVITARGFDIENRLKDYIQAKIERLAKYGNKIYHASVIVEQTKKDFNAEILIHLKNKTLIAKEESSDAHAAFDIAVENMKVQLRRRADKVHMRRRRILLKNIKYPVNALFGDKPSSDGVKIVRTDDFIAKPMSANEASQELVNLPNFFIVFKNTDTDEICVLYKRKDGTHGLVEPQL